MGRFLSLFLVAEALARARVTNGAGSVIFKVLFFSSAVAQRREQRGVHSAPAARIIFLLVFVYAEY